ncbi:hypothetical protein LPJ78_003746 [Coemansia sp. RSA 989]|nr:hypothetical protein BX667DRAFT_517621 [Coemansia mojavensis]KAJ1740913.1 hypothetical protein LPJ68_003333 [Coemansia sp. RSA 1086]KAJ1749706.1 hypothetical protein LPJ79_003501 [Coemansia sp. RSA 1821]KAJ1863897.1 hypothetical protein LPJ78_003746 [Coemansia sp. RSA 989]KAJ1871622.1 hypothetical protein LPJ55_003742 [Coemansia sp. RSA 990]KAJ2651439.1 hypothetical protein IWW40_001630 [Coemansia sp. RSA 1250]KAJ2674334.1 hypothetical protein IWW42_001834 [Coemansia sp. RSA 1085]
MDYFEALKTSNEASHVAHSPLPLPSSHNVGDVINYIKHTCDDLYFSSDSDEPVQVYQLSNTGLQALEADIDKLKLPSAHDFAVFVAGDIVPTEEGFISEKRPVSWFFERLCNQQIDDRQKRLAQALRHAFAKLTEEPGTDLACYRVGIVPNIEVYVVMLIDGQVVGIRTLSVET